MKSYAKTHSDSKNIMIKVSVCLFFFTLFRFQLLSQNEMFQFKGTFFAQTSGVPISTSRMTDSTHSRALG